VRQFGPLQSIRQKNAFRIDSPCEFGDSVLRRFRKSCSSRRYDNRRDARWRREGGFEPIIANGEAVVEVGEELVADRSGDMDRPRLAELLCVLLVDLPFGVSHQLAANATLAPLVGEVKRPVLRRIDADDSPLEHLVEIVGPRLVHKRELPRIAQLGRGWCRSAGALGQP
jgi:hypothetical protein